METHTMNKADFNKWMKKNKADQYKASATSDGFMSNIFFVNDKIESDIIFITHYNKPIAYVVKSLDELKDNAHLQKIIFRVIGLNYIFDSKNEMICSIYRKEEKAVSEKIYNEYRKMDHENFFLKERAKNINDYLMSIGKNELNISDPTRKDILKMIDLFKSDEVLNGMFLYMKKCNSTIKNNIENFTKTYGFNPCDYSLTKK